MSAAKLARDLQKLETILSQLPDKVREELLAAIAPAYELKATKNARKYVDSGATIGSQKVEIRDESTVLSYGTRAAQYLVGGKGKASKFGSGKTRVFRPKGLRAMVRKAAKAALAKVQAEAGK